ncbi:hypothetical protein EDB84DRAFT_1268997 [Lactarius hengduanensis]|nr:hypothetical protein EDB84DRAFT_1268997 [Lactarius hengduanensis]
MIGEKDSSSRLFDLSPFPIAGLHNIFLGGVLHRDVSDGNILRLAAPRACRPELGKDVNLTSCRGLLVDLDHAIEWRKVPPTPSRDRSGTLPFISLRLVNAWSRNVPALHTAADDLESFMWVLVWSLVHIFKNS